MKLSHVKTFASFKKIDGNHRRILRLFFDLALIQEECHVLGVLSGGLLVILVLSLPITNFSDPQSSVDSLGDYLLKILQVVGIEILHFVSRQYLIHSEDEYVFGSLLGSATSGSILNLRPKLVVLRLSAGCGSLSRHVVDDSDAIDLCILSVAWLIFYTLRLEDDELEKELLLLHPLVPIVFDALVIHRVLLLQGLDHQVLFAFVQSHDFPI